MNILNIQEGYIRCKDSETISYLEDLIENDLLWEFVSDAINEKLEREVEVKDDSPSLDKLMEMGEGIRNDVRNISIAPIPVSGTNAPKGESLIANEGEVPKPVKKKKKKKKKVEEISLESAKVGDTDFGSLLGMFNSTFKE